MNEESETERITKWTDDLLNDQDLHDLLDAQPELRGEKAEVLGMGNLLREQFPQEMELPFPEGFNRQVLRRIEESSNQTLEAKIQRFFSWFTLSDWALPAAASAALAVLLLAGMRIGGPGDGVSRVVHVYAPNPGHRVESSWVPQAEAAVIKMDGLEPLTPEVPIAGFFIDRSEFHPALASTVYFGESGEVQLALMTDGEGNPTLTSLVE